MTRKKKNSAKQLISRAGRLNDAAVRAMYEERYSAALQMFDRAEELIGSVPKQGRHPQLEIGITINRAHCFWSMECWDDALTELQSSHDLFKGCTIDQLRDVAFERMTAIMRTVSLLKQLDRTGEAERFLFQTLPTIESVVYSTGVQYPLTLLVEFFREVGENYLQFGDKKRGFKFLDEGYNMLTGVIGEAEEPEADLWNDLTDYACRLGLQELYHRDPERAVSCFDKAIEGAAWLLENQREIHRDEFQRLKRHTLVALVLRSSALASLNRSVEASQSMDAALKLEAELNEVGDDTVEIFRSSILHSQAIIAAHDKQWELASKLNEEALEANSGGALNDSEYVATLQGNLARCYRKLSTIQKTNRSKIRYIQKSLKSYDDAIASVNEHLTERFDLIALVRKFQFIADAANPEIDQLTHHKWYSERSQELAHSFDFSAGQTDRSIALAYHFHVFHERWLNWAIKYGSHYSNMKGVSLGVLFYRLTWGRLLQHHRATSAIPEVLAATQGRTLISSILDDALSDGTDTPEPVKAFARHRRRMRETLAMIQEQEAAVDEQSFAPSPMLADPDRVRTVLEQVELEQAQAATEANVGSDRPGSHRFGKFEGIPAEPKPSEKGPEELRAELQRLRDELPKLKEAAAKVEGFEILDAPHTQITTKRLQRVLKRNEALLLAFPHEDHSHVLVIRKSGKPRQFGNILPSLASRFDLFTESLPAGRMRRGAWDVRGPEGLPSGDAAEVPKAER
ncbi:hypothetical protein JMM61_20600, partial [Rhodovulum sulfidophilum]|uniref:tetratricopeptide repeat protein n=1 Tax=Rhodovulum sulfidophilum TaxID=35806 RepID=UPI00192586E8